ncbi:MAG: hypothetical protein ABL877_05550 [Thiobacillus sp.]
MTEEPRSETTQLNLADNQRVAGRDYYEGAPDSVKLYLVSKPDAVLDSEAIGNERLFYSRFNLDAPKIVRRQYIAYKQQHDFTDFQIRWLRWSGHLRIKGQEVTLVPDRMMPVAGWMQVGLLSLVFSAGMLQIARSTVPDWKQMLGQLVLATLWMGAWWLLHRLYIAPWRVLKRAGVTVSSTR